jgi:signal transduction histidine kinase
MLHEFILANRDEIIARIRTKVQERPAPKSADEELKNGVPLFLEQLVVRLQGDKTSAAKMNVSALTHGGDMLQNGFSVAQVIQGYGDVCQAITELAIQKSAAISTEDFRMLNESLDTATTEAVREYERQRDRHVSDRGTEQLGHLAHELRNALGTAMLAYETLKRGETGVRGSTGAILGRSLSTLQTLVDRSLVEVRLETSVMREERIGLRGFIEEVEVAATFEASERGVVLSVAEVPAGVVIVADRHLLASAVGNLVQNACKFTRRGGRVVIESHATVDRVLIAVRDECGGLPPGKSEELFQPFTQSGADRSGLGLGLTISRKAVERIGGRLRVENYPREGCCFIVDLARAPSTD